MKQIYFSLLSLFVLPAFAQHTFSICAVDPITGEVGSAGASCIQTSHIISDVHPGVGVIHTQSYYLSNNQNYAEELMELGVAPDAIIDSMIENDQQGNPSIRQYGVVDLVDGGRSAAFTGENCSDWKGHLTGSTYAIQGNILLGPEILDSMEAKFLYTEGNLACKLMASLQGANVPGADTRCLKDGISSLSAFIRVAKSSDPKHDLWLDLRVLDVEGIGIDPIDSLQIMFDALGGCDFVEVTEADKKNIHPTIYPQPSTNMVIFSLDGNFESIEIYDSKGQLIVIENIYSKNSISIYCKNWAPGIYFYLLKSGNNINSGKIIIQ